MNAHPENSHQIPETSLALRLPSLGLLMDEMEQGHTPVSARQYRKVALEATALIRANPKHADVRVACIKSPALAQVLQNILIELAFESGEMTWLHPMKF